MEKMEENKLRLLVVDDDPLIIQSIGLCLPEHWIMVVQNTNQFEPSTFFHAAFVDIHLSGNIDKAEGIHVIKSLHRSQPLSEIVSISGNLKREVMESSLKAGATRFLAKPLVPDEIKLVLEKIETLWLIRGVSLENKKQVIPWVGVSQSADRVRRFVASMSYEKAPILLEGESGTGKEVVAQMLHQTHWDRPFVAINVATLSENLFESELFGHLKGAFTGAIQNKVGWVERAHGGALFLDEVEALSLSHQAKLLRFLETGEFQKVGSTESQKVDIRIIAATNEKLEELVEKGQFREDLMYRLKGHRLEIPPLRERKEDIKLLCQHFLSQRDITMKKSMGEDAIEQLQLYPWPGNVRELKRTCEHLALMSPLPIIRGEDVKRVLYQQQSPIVAGSLNLDRGLALLLQDHEKFLIEQALELELEVDDLAKKLQISRSSLYKKVKDYQLEMRK